MSKFKMYKKDYKITSPYGIRALNGIKQNHKGVDFVGLGSKDILSPVDGKVVTSIIIKDKANLTWQWGNYVCILDELGYRHYFCHLSDRKVKVGDKVSKGSIIGVEGDTGYSFGSHCHYEVRNKLNISVDPCEVFKGVVFDIGTYELLKVGDIVAPTFNFKIDKIYTKNGESIANISTMTGKCKITCKLENLEKVGK